MRKRSVSARASSGQLGVAGCACEAGVGPGAWPEEGTEAAGTCADASRALKTHRAKSPPFLMSYLLSCCRFRLGRDRPNPIPGRFSDFSVGVGDLLLDGLPRGLHELRGPLRQPEPVERVSPGRVPAGRPRSACYPGNTEFLPTRSRNALAAWLSARRAG